MSRIILWVIVIAILGAGAYAFTSERKTLIVGNDERPAWSGIFSGDTAGKVAGESAKATETIIGKASNALGAFVPQAIVEFVTSPGTAIKGQVAGAQQAAIEAVKNEIANIFNIATATPIGVSAEQMTNSTSGPPCIP